MKFNNNQVLDEGDFGKTQKLTERQLAGLVQSKVRYPKYILIKIDAEIKKRNLDKNDLLTLVLLEKNENTLQQNFNLFYKKNKAASIFLFLIVFLGLFSIPWASFVIIFSIYFSLKKYSIK